MSVRLVLLRSLAVAALCPFAASADVLRVDAAAAPGGDGSNWARAYDSLTDALAVAFSGDQIWVAGGEYFPELPAGRGATFSIPSGVKVYGGFEGDETSFAQRPADVFSNRTTLKGTPAGGAPVYTIVTLVGADSGTVLDGFVLHEALADGPGTVVAATSNGAAIHATDSAPVLRNLVITDCEASLGGGAIRLVGSSIDATLIDSCHFQDNIAGGSGGAIYSDVPLNIQGCVFQTNSAGFGGGAVRLAGAGVNHAVSNSDFRSNTADTGPAGAIYFSTFDANSGSIVERSEFRDNTGAHAGAIAYREDGVHAVRDSKFFKNEAISFGGGAIDHDDAATTGRLLVENCLITGNSSNNGSGGINGSSAGETHIVNCTIAENSVSIGTGGGVAASTGDVTIDNSILWANIPRSLFNNQVGSCTVNRSIIDGLGLVSPAPTGVGAVDADPLFVDIDGPDNTDGTPDDNARLMPGSPAIDAGHNLIPSPFVLSDVYADPRFRDDTGTPDTGVGDGVNAIIDMGAAEFQGTTPGGPCNNADLAEPFGTLDFSDVLAFLSAFGASDPDADLAAPFGVFDFSDVLAFLSAFGSGCP